MVARRQRTLDPDKLALACLADAGRVARKAAQRWGVPWLTDECESEALVWVVVAARHYDPGCGADPKLCVLRYVRGRVNTFLQSDQRSRLRVRRLAHELSAAADRRAATPANAGYEDATGHLTPREKAVMDRIFLDGYGTVTAAPTLGLSRSTSCLTYRRALARVAERVGADWRWE